LPALFGKASGEREKRGMTMSTRENYKQEILRLREVNAALLAVLKLAEWGADDSCGDRCCPVCYCDEKTGHAKDCKLAATIAKAEGKG
jgi:hypothetical protein